MAPITCKSVLTNVTASAVTLCRAASRVLVPTIAPRPMAYGTSSWHAPCFWNIDMTIRSYWITGRRVFVEGRGEGTIDSVNGRLCYVIFDDGGGGWFYEWQLEPR
jgi:hypothetical protein